MSICLLITILNKKMGVIRQTVQKTRILEFLKGVKTHPTAEIIYKNIKKNIPTISLATVYRNLNSLADRNEIFKFEVNNEFHFDGDISNHQHCICKNCGKISDVFQDNISKYAMKKISLSKNKFYPEKVNIFYSGLCKKCKRGKK